MRRNLNGGLNDEIEATNGVLAILTNSEQLNAAPGLEGVESERVNLRARVGSLDVGLDRLAVIVAQVLSSAPLGVILDVELLNEATFFGVLLDEHLRDLGRGSSEGQLEVVDITITSDLEAFITLLDAEAAVKRGVGPVWGELGTCRALSKEVEDDSSEHGLLLHGERRGRSLRIRLGLSSTSRSSPSLFSLFIALLCSSVGGILRSLSTSRHVSHRVIEPSGHRSGLVL